MIVILVAGLGTWLVAGSGTDTIGASGVVFGYAGYLIARGFFTRNVGSLAVGVLVALLFGAALASDLVPQAGISWEDHLFGGLGGDPRRPRVVRRPANGRTAALEPGTIQTRKRAV